MSYTLTIPIQLRSDYTGQTLNAFLYDTNSNAVGSAITTGFTEVGNGIYQFTNTYSDGFTGLVKFTVPSNSGIVITAYEVSPPASSSSGGGFDTVIETGVNATQALQLLLAKFFGNVSRNSDGSISYSAVENPSTPRFTITYNQNGDPSNIAFNV